MEERDSEQRKKLPAQLISWYNKHPNLSLIAIFIIVVIAMFALDLLRLAAH